MANVNIANLFHHDIVMRYQKPKRSMIWMPSKPALAGSQPLMDELYFCPMFFVFACSDLLLQHKWNRDIPVLFPNSPALTMFGWFGMPLWFPIMPCCCMSGYGLLCLIRVYWPWAPLAVMFMSKDTLRTGGALPGWPGLGPPKSAHTHKHSKYSVYYKSRKKSESIFVNNIYLIWMYKSYTVCKQTNAHSQLLSGVIR